MRLLITIKFLILPLWITCAGNKSRFENLSIIPADMDLAGAEIELAQSEDHLTRLREVLATLKNSSDYDYVIIDCPPSLGVLMTSALAAADELLIPLQCEFFALEGLSQLIKTIERVKQNLNPGLTIDGIVSQEEERGLFVKQSFKLEQFRNPGVGLEDLNNCWYYAHENEFNIADGAVPFTKTHTITDSLLLNKTFRNVTFSPDGCNNFLRIDSVAATRLAPLLCADTTYKNVTRPPIITTNGAVRHNYADVQMGDYNRFWFGGVQDFAEHPAPFPHSEIFAGHPLPHPVVST